MIGILLVEAQKKFIDFLKNNRRASATILAYGKDINQIIDFLSQKAKLQADDITQADLEAFLSKLSREGYTPKSVSRKINSIKTFFKYLKDQQFVGANPAILISHPKFEAKPPRVLSKMEYRALRDACRHDIRMSAVVETLLQTGIRIGELAALKVENIQDGLVIVPQIEGHPKREIPLNKAVKQAIEQYLTIRPKTENNTLFVTKTGKPLLIRNIRTAIDRYFHIAGIKSAKVNDLRHTWVAHHLMSGTSLVTVSKLAGHKRLSTTERYLHLIKDQLDEKVKLEEL
jgi:site-specific recombinase XerD